MMRIVFCFLLSLSVAYATEMLPNSSQYLFATSIFTEIDAPISTCDSSAINDPHGEWLCAQAPQDYAGFIRSWEHSVALTPDLTALSNWAVFNDANGNLTFYARAYTFQQTQLVVSYNPSDVGREISIGVSPHIAKIMAYAHHDVDIHEIFSATAATPANAPVPNTVSSTAPNRNDYNCSDFATQTEAIDFFNRNGFSVSYDPYYLDGNNNGIPCEDPDRTQEANYQRQNSLSSQQPNQEATQCAAGESWVAAYVRSDGVQVRGHCRKNR